LRRDGRLVRPGQRKLEYDGLGHLTSVCEILTSGGTSCGQSGTASGYLTSYSYSTPASGGSQMVVTQGAQTRTYLYDGMGRLTSETNPESGTTTYTYDSANTAACGSVNQSGDLLVVTDNANNYFCYQNDSVYRPLAVGNSHASTSPCKRFWYNTTAGFTGGQGAPSGYIGSNIKGRLVEAETDDCTWPTSPAHMLTDEWFSYDANGRMTDLWEYTPFSKVYYHTTVSYWPNDVPKTLSGLPGYATLTYGVEGEGRWNSATLGTATIVSNVIYSPAGPTEVDIGAGTDKDIYSYDIMGRMQLYQFFVGSQNNKGAPHWNANGTLQSLAITDGFNSSDSQTCTFGYDDLARLTGDNCGSVWSQTFSYDRYGNLTQAGSASSACAGCYNPSNNQYQTLGTTYDPDGNLTKDPTGNLYSWDVYGKRLGATYDAFGRATNAGKEILYSPLGKTAVLINSTTFYNSYIPLPGGGQLSMGGGSFYLHKDWLGTSRVASSVPASGNGGLTYDRSFAPFGQQYLNQGFQSPPVFAGNTSDLVTGSLFDTPNREYHAIEGRWISPDPAGLSAVDMSNPQSWIRYAYVLNNPLFFTDPQGLWCAYFGDNGDRLESIDDNSNDNECGSNGGYWIEGSYGGGSWLNINVNAGTVMGLGYGSNGNSEISVAGAMGSNSWRAWTQTFNAPGLQNPAANNSRWGWNFTRSLFGGFRLPTYGGSSCLSVATSGFATAGSAALNAAKKVQQYAPLAAQSLNPGISASGSLYTMANYVQQMGGPSEDVAAYTIAAGATAAAASGLSYLGSQALTASKAVFANPYYLAIAVEAVAGYGVIQEGIAAYRGKCTF
jgi:RHS repeat-associated protein